MRLVTISYLLSMKKLPPKITYCGEWYILSESKGDYYKDKEYTPHSLSYNIGLGLTIKDMKEVVCIGIPDKDIPTEWIENYSKGLKDKQAINRMVEEWRNENA